jgi:hypothetical protein
MTKLKGDIFKDHSDKLGLLWTNDQWQTVMDAMDEYAQQEVKNIVIQADVMQRSGQLLQAFKEGFSAAADGLKGVNDMVQKRSLQ